MGLDPEMRALIAAAERGEDVPEVTVMAGGMRIVGQPAGAPAFAAAVRQSKVEEFAASLIPPSGWKGMQKVNKVDARAEAERMADAFAGRLTAETADTESLTLINAKVIPAQGDGLLLPALRVPTASIDAWWIGHGQVLKAGQAGFVAVSFPLPS